MTSCKNDLCEGSGGVASNTDISVNKVLFPSGSAPFHPSKLEIGKRDNVAKSAAGFLSSDPCEGERSLLLISDDGGNSPSSYG